MLGLSGQKMCKKSKRGGKITLLWDLINCKGAGVMLLNSDNIKTTMNAWEFFSEIDLKLSGIALSYLATSDKISEVSNTPWWDDSLGRYEQKARMKEVGGGTFQFLGFLHENSVLALTKVIEDISIQLKRDLKFKFDSVRCHHDVIYLKELQTLRALSNVIKHNVSFLDRKSSESAKFLVDDCGLVDGHELRYYILSNHEVFKIIDYIPKLYISMLSLVEKAIGVKHPLLDKSFEEAFNIIYEHLVPEVFQLKRPRKLLKQD